MMLLLFVSLLATAALGAECPALDDPFYFIPHETDCSKFYICAHGVPQLQTCPEGTHFSPSHMVCQNPVFAGCDNSLPDLCPDWSLLPRPHPDSCSQFYVCVHGTVQVFDCPQGLEFNAELLQCVWPAEANCSIPQAAPGAQDQATDGEQVDEQIGEQGCEEGVLSANVDCSKYNVCSQGVLVTVECPSGLHWNSELAFCDWPASAGCV